MKLWVDSVRPAPNDTEYTWMKSADVATFALTLNERKGCPYEGIDIGHVKGGFGCENGLVFLQWLEHTRRQYPVHVHTLDPFEKGAMEEIVRRNGWDKLQKYTVGFAVDGRAYVDVRAESPAKAADLGAVDFAFLDLGELECVDFRAVIAHDENDEIVDDCDVANGDWYKAGAEQNYTVGYAVDGRVYVGVIARSPADAVRKAEGDFGGTSLGVLEVVGWKPVNVEDEKGKLYDDERELFGNGRTVDGLISEAAGKCSKMRQYDKNMNMDLQKG